MELCHRTGHKNKSNGPATSTVENARKGTKGKSKLQNFVFAEDEMLAAYFSTGCWFEIIAPYGGRPGTTAMFIPREAKYFRLRECFHSRSHFSSLSTSQAYQLNFAKHINTNNNIIKKGHHKSKNTSHPTTGSYFCTEVPG